MSFKCLTSFSSEYVCCDVCHLPTIAFWTTIIWEEHLSFSLADLWNASFRFLSANGVCALYQTQNENNKIIHKIFHTFDLQSLWRRCSSRIFRRSLVRNSFSIQGTAFQKKSWLLSHLWKQNSVLLDDSCNLRPWKTFGTFGPAKFSLCCLRMWFR